MQDTYYVLSGLNMYVSRYWRICTFRCKHVLCLQNFLIGKGGCIPNCLKEGWVIFMLQYRLFSPEENADVLRMGPVPKAVVHQPLRP